VYELAAAILTAVRRHKALSKVSLRTRADLVVVRDTPERLSLVPSIERDLAEAGNIGRLETVDGDPFSVETSLATPD
jgi:hypothetical protein